VLIIQRKRITSIFEFESAKKSSIAVLYGYKLIFRESLEDDDENMVYKNADILP